MIFFRIGCIVLILTAGLHLLGHFQQHDAGDETERQLLDLMINYKIHLGNDVVTMMGMQKGFSLLFTLLLLWPGAMGLYLAKTSSSQALRNINFMYLGALVFETTISQIYFFIIPTACVALATLFFLIAAFRIK